MVGCDVCVCVCVCAHTHTYSLFPRMYILGRIFLADTDVTCWVDLCPGQEWVKYL